MIKDLNLGQKDTVLIDDSGIEYYMFPWADDDGTKYITCMVKGEWTAEIQTGGEEVHLTTDRKKLINSMIDDMQVRFGEKLTNPFTRAKFEAMAESFDFLMKTKSYTHMVCEVSFAALMLLQTFELR
jgi:hypothetical protein